MAYADSLRTLSPRPTMDDIATLIEGIFAPGYGLTWTSHTPTMGGHNTLVYTPTQRNCYYVVCGKLLIYQFQCAGSIAAGGSGQYIYLDLPYSVLGSAAGAYWIRRGGSDNAAYYYSITATRIGFFAAGGVTINVAESDLFYGTIVCPIV